MGTGKRSVLLLMGVIWLVDQMRPAIARPGVCWQPGGVCQCIFDWQGWCLAVRKFSRWGSRGSWPTKVTYVDRG